MNETFKKQAELIEKAIEEGGLDHEEFMFEFIPQLLGKCLGGCTLSESRVGFIIFTTVASIYLEKYGFDTPKDPKIQYEMGSLAQIAQRMARIIFPREAKPKEDNVSIMIQENTVADMANQILDRFQNAQDTIFQVIDKNCYKTPSDTVPGTMAVALALGRCLKHTISTCVVEDAVDDMFITGMAYAICRNIGDGSPVNFEFLAKTIADHLKKTGKVTKEPAVTVMTVEEGKNGGSPWTMT